MKLRLIIFFTFLSLRLFATHIVGGEIYYDCLGNNNYRITLKVYRDCFNGQAPFDPQAPVGIFDANGNLIQTLLIPLPGFTQLPVIMPYPCLIAPQNVCVEEAIYVSNPVNLPPIPGGYDVLYQRCCRNGTIINLQNPGATGATYMAHIPDPNVAVCNSSPRYVQFPPLFLCTNTPINFNHAATDPDGDVLVYSLCDAFEGASQNNPAPNPPAAPPINLVQYVAGYNAQYPLNSAPAIAIHPNTGFITGVPTQMGQYVVAVCVSEYRNGQLISVNKRDFQFNVLNCSNAIAALAIPNLSIFCDSLTVFFANNSVNATGYHWDFGVNNLTSDTSNQATPTYTYPDTGCYTAMLVAFNQNNNCFDTVYTTFCLYPKLDPAFFPPPPQCLNGNSFNFTAGGVFDPTATFLWNFGPNANPVTTTQRDPLGVTFNAPGNYMVVLTISQFGCVKADTQYVDVYADPVSIIGPQTQFCTGYTINFTNQSLNGQNYFWNFGDPLSLGDTSHLFQPSYTYSDSGVYTVMLVVENQGICIDTSYLTFYVYPLLDPQILPFGPQCISGNSFDFFAGGTYTDSTIISWNFGPNANPSVSNLENPTGIVFNAVGDFIITITMSENGCVKIFTDTVHIFPMPTINFGAVPLEGCEPLTVQFFDSSFAATAIIYHWDFGDGDTSNIQNPEHIYLKSGSYSVKLTIRTISGCVQTLTLNKPNFITVHPLPTAGIDINPTEASIFEPYITFTDKGINHTDCFLMFGDGTSSDTCDVTHTYRDTGLYNVKQIVYNEFGCSDTLYSTVYISPEYRFWVPNAFTPNSDGNNDVFLPVMLGVKEFNMKIYDRWGELIFETNDKNFGWNGTCKGEKVQMEVYVYKIELTNVFDKKFNFVRTVTLVR